MVPKVTSAGRSFKGAARYYLHDKQANTSERVAFVETVNLPTDDPRRAVAHMIDTATHADQLKRNAGLRGGRKLDKPVYTYALTWHPSEKPTKSEQLEAARESLKALGMADRQAIIVAHHDTDHPHVHVMVNRVCPETGRAASNSNDRLKLSEWAQGYEQERGRVFCDKRVENNAARKSGQWRKDGSPSRSAWVEWKKAQTRDLWDEFRAKTADLKDARKGQYEALWQQKEERFASRRDEIKAVYKPMWRDVFKRQREQLRDHDRSMVIRLGNARRLQGTTIKGMFQAMTNDVELRQELIKFHAQERKDLAAKQGQTIRDAGREVTKAYKYDRSALRAAHKAEDDGRHRKTKERSKAVWNAPDKPREVFKQSNDQPNEKGQENAQRSSREVMAEQRSKARGRTRTRTRKPRR